LRRADCALGATIAALLGFSAAQALAAEPKAAIEGDLDRGLRQELKTAIGEAKANPENPFDARRRARDAVADAIALLRSEAYYEATVEPDVSASDPPQSILRVTVGPRFLFTEPLVEWVGAPPSADAAAASLAALGLAKGSPGRAADVLAAEGRLVAVLEKRGYADAQTRPREVVVDHADHSVRPTLKIAAGDLVRLDGIEVVTKGRTNAAWVRGLSPWRAGAVYTPKAVAELERRLLAAGVYDSVTVALAPADQADHGLRPVVVSLADRPRHTVELGASYSTSEGSGVDAKWIVYNTLHRADFLTLSAHLYDIQQKLDLELDLPDWRRPDQVLKIGGGPVGDRTKAYDDLGGGVRVEVERRYTPTSYVTVGGALDYSSTTERDAVNLLATPVGERLNLFIVTVAGAFAVDHANDLLDPTRGWRFDARAEPTLISGDRDLVYLKTQAQVSGYLPLSGSAATVVAARLKAGAILGGDIPTVPAERRFFAGGGGSVRGFAYQAVGPRLSDNTPEGGLSLVEASVELRQRLSQRWGVVAFADAGAVGARPTPSLANISAGVGIGVRYDLGFGPLRLDIATPLNPRKGDAAVQIYLSIGQSF
jgi:translocation and assembly module TamA